MNSQMVGADSRDSRWKHQRDTNLQVVCFSNNFRKRYSARLVCCHQIDPSLSVKKRRIKARKLTEFNFRRSSLKPIMRASIDTISTRLSGGDGTS